MVTQQEELITVRQAAMQSGRTAEAVRRWVREGKLPAEKLGNQLFVRKSDLALLLSRRAQMDRTGQADVLEALKSHRERIRRRLGRTVDVLALLDESRESHP
ncbi:MAG: helix-turn-helix domain-containing protein [Chloroflexi bacterium]|nr:helix-turn-helix domain-containing protein [Chloroflexota bacterium]